MSVRNTLNRLLWDPKQSISDYELTYIHRGAPGDQKTIPCSQITEIRASYFTYGEEETLIPYHRVTQIRNTHTGQAILQRKPRENPKRRHRQPR